MESARERTGKEKGEVEADVRVDRSPTRCPYCHADVAPDPTEWVACAGCLARHHAGCWGEAGRCGTCQGATKLAVVVSPRPTDDALAELLRDGRAADARAALRAAGVAAERDVDAELLRVALGELHGARARARAQDARGAVTRQVGLGLQSAGFLVLAVDVLQRGRPDVGLGVFLVGWGLSVLVPVVAAILGVGLRLRMLGQAALSLALGLGFFGLAELMNPGVDGPGRGLLAALALVFAGLAGFTAWAIDRPRAPPP